jgi:hypothetical protein
MSNQRPSFAKREREMKLKDKARAKAERRAARKAARTDPADPVPPSTDDATSAPSPDNAAQADSSTSPQTATDRPR